MVIAKHRGRITISLHGPETGATRKDFPPEAEWLPLLDQEIQKLPDKYRLPLILCDLQGQTRKQAAQHTANADAGQHDAVLEHGQAARPRYPAHALLDRIINEKAPPIRRATRTNPCHPCHPW